MALLAVVGSAAVLLLGGGSPSGRIGLSTNLLGSGEDLRTQLATLHDAGIRWIREDSHGSASNRSAGGSTGAQRTT